MSQCVRAHSAPTLLLLLFRLHLSCAMCPLRAVVRVNSAPQRGHADLAAVPDFSRWWRSKLLKVENCRPLHPWSQHWGFGLELMILTPLPSSDPDADTSSAELGTT